MEHYFPPKNRKKVHNDISVVAEKSNKKYDFGSLKWHNFEINTVVERVLSL